MMDNRAQLMNSPIWIERMVMASRAVRLKKVSIGILLTLASGLVGRPALFQAAQHEQLFGRLRRMLER
jgi:hypothetical protein